MFFVFLEQGNIDVFFWSSLMDWIKWKISNGQWHYSLFLLCCFVVPSLFFFHLLHRWTNEKTLKYFRYIPRQLFARMKQIMLNFAKNKKIIVHRKAQNYFYTVIFWSHSISDWFTISRHFENRKDYFLCEISFLEEIYKIKECENEMIDEPEERTSIN